MKTKVDIAKETIDDFRARSEARKPFETSWRLNLNFLMGNQYCGVGYGGSLEQVDRQFFWQEREVFNHVAPIYDIRYARLTKLKPSLSVIPATNDDMDIKTAKVAKRILQSLSTKLDLSEKIDEALKWSESCGTAFYKVTWNGLAGAKVGKANGVDLFCGEVDISVCSPFEIYPDSNSCTMKECQSIIHAKAYSVSQIKSMYGVDVEGKSINIFSLGGANTGFGGLGYNSQANKLGETTVADSALVLEKYIRPTSEYPNGRLIIVAGDKLVFDGDLPYAVGTDGVRDFPFIRQSSLEEAGNFWGVSPIARIIPVQRAYNAIKNRKHEFINRLSMGILSVEDGSIDLENLEDEGLCPGKILVYRQGSTQPEYLETESLPSGISDEEEKLLDEFEKISGVTETFDSSLMSSNVSGAALELMLAQDEVRINATAQSLQSAVKEVGRKVLRLYKQYAVFPRLARLVGENGKVDLFYFSSSDITSDDVTIETPTDSGETITQRRDMVFKLLSAGLLDDENGKLTTSMKNKVMQMLGLGNWESAVDLAALHTKKAETENLGMAAGIAQKPCEIDDHEAHISAHTAFVLGGLTGKESPKAEKLLLEHIKAHKMLAQSEKA